MEIRLVPFDPGFLYTKRKEWPPERMEAKPQLSRLALVSRINLGTHISLPRLLENSRRVVGGKIFLQLALDVSG